MAFRVATLFYISALVAAAMAVLEPMGGLLVSCGILLLWMCYANPSLRGLFVTVGFLFLIAFVAVEASPYSQEVVQTEDCKTDLHWVAMAVLFYESGQKTLPPAKGSLGTSGDTQSWRLLVWPYMAGNHPHVSVYKIYNINEPWNGPRNSTLGGLDLLVCPSHGIIGNTSYLAVVDPQCIWHDGPPRSLDDITDDHSQTILLIDVGHSDVDWKEPRDLTFNEAIDLLTAPVDPNTFTGHSERSSYFHNPYYFRNVAMLDGSVRRIKSPLDHETAVALLTANGGETLDENLLENLGRAELRYDRICGLTLVAAIALLPVIPSVRRRVLPMVPNEAELTRPPSPPA